MTCNSGFAPRCTPPRFLSASVFSFLLLLGCFVLPANAQESFDPETSLFVPVSDQPVIPHGLSADWDSRYTDPGAAFYHDGQYHMFRNGFRGWPASVEIAYHTSPDGITWTEMSEEPIIYTADVPYAGVAALASSAVVAEDGTWMLYFYTWHRQPGGEIGLATASDPLGEWTIHEPVLSPGSEGSWDSVQISAPSVIRTEDGYQLWYSGHGTDGSRQIGYATSEDGFTWTKHDDPATTDPLYAESDPVMLPGDEGTWDAGEVAQPRVLLTPEGYTMIYRAVPGIGDPSLMRQMNLGIATSDDGFTWERRESNPVINRLEYPASTFWFTAAAYNDGLYSLYIEFAAPGNKTSIYAAQYEGSLE